MTYVVLTGWREGVQKVALTKEFQGLPGISGLAAAKNLTDRLLGGERIRIVFDNRDEADAFLQLVKPLGVDGVIEEP